MSRRQRTKSTKHAQKLLPEAQVTGYAIGRSGPNPMLTVLAILGAFGALSVVIALATGAFVLPGVLLVLLLQHLLSPPRGIAVCDVGIALTNRSVLNGVPRKVLVRTAVADVRPVRTSAGRTQVAIGPDLVWLATAEEAILREALAAARFQAQQPGFAPPY